MSDLIHLSLLDGLFLHLETPEMPTHVGSLAILTPPPGGAAKWHQAVKAHIASRLHLIPAFTRKLAPMPLDLANPVWIAADDIDLDHHVRLVRLPAPGTTTQLEALAAQLHSARLDRSRPLWEFHVIDGLAHGRIGLYSKVHHAAVDGQAAVGLVKTIYDLTPEARSPRAPRSRADEHPRPGVGELLSALLGHQARQTAQAARQLPSIVAALYRGMKSAPGAQGEGADSAPSGLNLLRDAPPTPFNVSITPERAFAGVALPLAEVKALGRARGASVNDTVLWLCSTALRDWLARSHALPEEPLVAFVPISLRADGDTSANNQVSGALVGLATHISDPAARLDAIVRETRAMKAQMGPINALIPKNWPSLGSPWLLSGLAALYGRTRLAERLRVANLTVSNVPGSQVPLYLAGARLDAMYPMSIVLHGVALNITIHSCLGQLCFGLVACRRAAPDLRGLAKRLESAMQALRKLPLPAQPGAEVPAATSKPKRARRKEVA